MELGSKSQPQKVSLSQKQPKFYKFFFGCLSVFSSSSVLLVIRLLNFFKLKSLFLNSVVLKLLSFWYNCLRFTH